MTALAIALSACAIWGYLIVGRGGFWRAADRDDVARGTGEEPARWPRVVAVMPARDEASVVGESLASLLSQDYRGGPVDVIVVDDHSSDDTIAVARRTAAAMGASSHVAVLAAPALPDGWTGKLWALHQGIGHARKLPEPPEYLLLTDADIRYAHGTLKDLVARAVRDDLVLVSLMAKLRCVSVAERALIPAFVFFFQMLYPFAWVRSADRGTAAAAGGCLLVRVAALNDAGGVEGIRGELIDDCALARALKRRGRIWLGLTRRAESLRAYPTVADIGRMVIRSAYAQLRFRPLGLVAATAAMAATYLAPPALAVFGGGASQLVAALAWAAMTLAYGPILRFYGVAPWWALALPAIAGVYVAFTWQSAWRHLRGRGGEWKGRVHPRGASRRA